MQNCLALVPKAPRRDMHRLMNKVGDLGGFAAALQGFASQPTSLALSDANPQRGQCTWCTGPRMQPCSCTQACAQAQAPPF